MIPDYRTPISPGESPGTYRTDWRGPGSKARELVLTREAAGRLLALDGQGRPGLLRASCVRGQTKERLVVWEAAPSAGPRTGWLEVGSPRDFLATFDIVKLYSARGLRLLHARAAGLERAERGRLRRVFDTYGWQDPTPHITACVIGVGRLGSKTALALAEQGVRRFVLIDPENIERPNQQLMAYSRARIGTPKVNALAELLSPLDDVRPIHKSLWDLDERDWGQLADADVVFLCVDSALARLVACHRLMGLGLPVFEGGVEVDVRPERPSRLLGRVQTALPGNWCLFCLPGASDFSEAARELGVVDGGEPAERRQAPSDPTLSEWIASSMVLLFRQALMGGGVWPQYLFRLDGNSNRDAARAATIAERPPLVDPAARCRRCRPAFHDANLLLPPELGRAVPQPHQGATSLARAWERLKRSAAGRLERAVLRTAAPTAGLAGAAASLALTSAILLAVRYMIGFSTHTGELPSLGHFIWHFGAWRYPHHVGHYFGLVTGALVLTSLPYILFGLPLWAARWAYESCGSWVVRRRARRGLSRAFSGLEELRSLPSSRVRFRPSPRFQTLFVRGTHCTALGAEAFAVMLLVPIYKAGGLWIWLSMIAVMGTSLLIRGLIKNHEVLGRFILRLCGEHLPARTPRRRSQRTLATQRPRTVDPSRTAGSTASPRTSRH